MEEIVAVPDGGYLEIPNEKNEPIDLLEREEFVQQIMDLLNLISENKGSCTFALNGEWGVGKTFVLNMLCKKLEEYQAGEKYLVFYYNCWKYDYYEEPLLAVVAALSDYVDQEGHLFSSAVRQNIEAIKKCCEPLVDNSLMVLGYVGKAASVVKTVQKQRKELELEKNRYNRYFSFGKSLEQVKEKLKKLTETTHLVVVVDELDRCLPDYAIKVMERLHHLFDDLENCSVILSVDKTQLDHTVKQVFGEETNTEKYLKKFISFELSLNKGSVNNNFREKYREYFSFFDDSLITTQFDFDKFFSEIFYEIDVRTQERMMNRILTIHKIVFSDTEKMDYSVLCFELLFLVIYDYAKRNRIMPIIYDGEHFSIKQTDMLNVHDISHISFYMQKYWRNSRGFSEPAFIPDARKKYICFRELDIPQLLTVYFSRVYPEENRYYQMKEYAEIRYISEDRINQFEKIKQLLEIIQ